MSNRTCLVLHLSHADALVGAAIVASIVPISLPLGAPQRRPVATISRLAAGPPAGSRAARAFSRAARHDPPWRLLAAITAVTGRRLRSRRPSCAARRRAAAGLVSRRSASPRPALRSVNSRPVSRGSPRRGGAFSGRRAPPRRRRTPGHSGGDAGAGTYAGARPAISGACDEASLALSAPARTPSAPGRAIAEIPPDAGQERSRRPTARAARSAA